MEKQRRARPQARAQSLRLDIDVSSEMIEEAIRGNSSHCMVADAIKAAYPDLRYVAVDIQTIRYTDPKTGLRHIALTPRGIQQQILDFDQGKKPEPFSCQVRPSQILEAGGRGRKVKAGGPLPEAAKAAKAAEGPQPESPEMPTFFGEPPKKKKRRRARLVKEKNTSGTDTGAIPVKVGGRAPPQMSVRREFGIRAYR